MPQIELNEQIFEIAQRRAAERGYSSVEEFVANAILDNFGEAVEFEHLFTSDRVAELQRISAEIKAGGKTYTMAEVEEHFRNKSKAWLANRAT